MIKIQPTTFNNFEYIKPKPIINKITESVVTNPVKAGIAAAGATGIVLSSMVSDFYKTVDNNYFQFKTNSKTNKPYAPDIFQKAAAMNLYLGNDVLVTAPTGTGKTAIAEYIITKNLKEGKKTFYTTPLKALSNEKFLDFSKTYGSENVGIITGDTKINTDAPIIIMTTEIYRNMAISEKFRYDQNDKIGLPKDLQTVIFDELQYLGDIDRGGIWEQAIMFTPKKVQMLSLSATIGNNVEINDWMALTRQNKKSVNVTPAKGYMPLQTNERQSVLINVPSENRHVPLNFVIAHAKAERSGISKFKEALLAKAGDDAYKNITRYLYEKNQLPAIYFVFSKKDCKHLLKMLSKEGDIITTKSEQKQIENIIDSYKKRGIYLGENLDIEALKKGYAIHNAGFLPSQKRLIEELFQKKLVKVVLATETLSAGINMPAKTTVISSHRKPAATSDGEKDHKRNLTPNEFHQMAGRAGRRGIDTEGFCYAFKCNKEQADIMKELINSPSNELQSNLNIDYSFICNYLSEFKDDEMLYYILSKSLYAYDSTKNTFDQDKIGSLIKTYNLKRELLADEGFLDNNYQTTIKGEMLKGLNGYEQIPVMNYITSKSLQELNPIQLAGIIGGLANPDCNKIDDIPLKQFDIKSVVDEKLAKEVANLSQEFSAYNQKIKAFEDTQEIKLNEKTIARIYTWAKLNQARQNSRQNWAYMYSKDNKISMIDEGSFFREITMTCDLIKQLVKIAEYGEKIADTKEDEIYYKNLSQKLDEVLKLIQQEPANEQF